MGDVTTTQSYPESRAAASASAAPPSAGSVTAITGTSMGSAPASRSAVASEEAWARVRVTTTRRPNSGRCSNHDSSSAATSPMTMTDGAARSWSARVPSVARVVVCSGRVPQRTAAAGVSAERPPSMSWSAMRRRRATPMRITTVPPTWATARQSTDPSSPTEGSSCPVTTVNDVDEWRSVTGMPA